ncbi:MAG: hypothetical protein R3E39_11720 [Anaerolineae bacterium]
MTSTAIPQAQAATKTGRWSYLLDNERFLGGAAAASGGVQYGLVGIPFVLAILFSFGR